MAKYTDSKCRLCRREGEKLFLKGEKCYTAKCAMEKRAYPPGQHGQRRTRLSDYALQLREKQNYVVFMAYLKNSSVVIMLKQPVLKALQVKTYCNC
jgi:small subunit ribosomal protein S4